VIATGCKRRACKERIVVGALGKISYFVDCSLRENTFQETKVQYINCNILIFLKNKKCLSMEMPTALVKENRFEQL
jgi:hypothetical protein